MTLDSMASTLCRVFSSEILASGENRIGPIDHDLDFGFPVSAFLGRVALMNSACSEVYVVDRRQRLAIGESLPRQATDACVAIAKAASVHNVWIISDSFESAASQQVGAINIFHAHTAEILKALLSVPPAAGEAFCQRAGTDLMFLQNTYRLRAATGFAFDAKHSAMRRAEPLDLDQFLVKWSESSDSQTPVLILGDRGSGKTWQLLHFCVYQNARHASNPSSAPPAIFVNLRGLAAEWASHRAVDLFALVTRQHGWLNVKWNSSMFAALVREGLVILCMDGFDEIQRQPS